MSAPSDNINHVAPAVNEPQWIGTEGDPTLQLFDSTSLPSQQPQFLWIGCSDSRVSDTFLPPLPPPEEEVTSWRTGLTFVHRNIANQFQLGDTSAQSVLNYAVQVLRVREVWVVGHTDCGGVQAAFRASQRNNNHEVLRPDLCPPGDNCVCPQGSTHRPWDAYTAESPINQWLTPLTDLSRSLFPIPKDSSMSSVSIDNNFNVAAKEKLTRENVRAQVRNLSHSWSIQHARRTRQRVVIRGFVYNIDEKKFDVVCVDEGTLSNISTKPV